MSARHELQTSPYRVDAHPPARPGPRFLAWLRRAAVAACAAGAVVVAGLLVVSRLPWTPRSAALHTAPEALPAGHAKVGAVAWGRDGSAAAVGAGGEIDFAEATEIVTDPGTVGWQRVASGTRADLHAVGLGSIRHDYVERASGTVQRVVPIEEGALVAAGDEGVVVVCASFQCDLVASGTSATLRGVAYTGGDAIVVGDRGTAVFLHKNTFDWLTLGGPDTAVHAYVDERIGGTTATLRAIDATELLRVAVGDGGTIVESERGAAWSLSRSPVNDDLVSAWDEGGAFFAATRAGTVIERKTNGTWVVSAARRWLAVDVTVTEGKLWRRRDTAATADVSIGAPPTARIGTTLVPLDTGRTFVAGAESPYGSRALLVDDAGDVYLTR